MFAHAFDLKKWVLAEWEQTLASGCIGGQQTTLPAAQQKTQIDVPLNAPTNPVNIPAPPEPTKYYPPANTVGLIGVRGCQGDAPYLANDLYDFRCIWSG